MVYVLTIVTLQRTIANHIVASCVLMSVAPRRSLSLPVLHMHISPAAPSCRHCTTVIRFVSVHSRGNRP